MSKSIIIITTFPPPIFAMVHFAPFPPCVDAPGSRLNVTNIKLLLGLTLPHRIAGTQVINSFHKTFYA